MKKIAFGAAAFSFATFALGAGTMANSALETKDDVSLDLITGTWTVHENGVENKTIKMVFDKHHHFKFNCSGAKSEGDYEIHDGAIFLDYKKVDGERVSFDSKKRLPLADDFKSFQVDCYHYERAN
jgi:hypothetical protein